MDRYWLQYHGCYYLLSPEIPLNPYPLQLIGGRNSSEGRVEIYYNNEWGTICDDHWTLNEANVVCRSLGFPGALEAVTRARYNVQHAQLIPCHNNTAPCLCPCAYVHLLVHLLVHYIASTGCTLCIPIGSVFLFTHICTLKHSQVW